MFPEFVNFLSNIDDQLLTAITGGRPGHFPWILVPLLATFGTIWALGGRTWAMVYFVTIPFLNWSFGVVNPWTIFEPSDTFAKGVELHPLTMVTGLVFVFRDFVQRGMGQKVLIVMALAIAWSFYYAWPVIALASGIAFAVSEMADWALYTFTKYRLSTRILLSSALASPIDTTIFLYGADLAVWMNDNAIRDNVIKFANECDVKHFSYVCESLTAIPPIEPGSMLHWANWVVFIIGKMVGAVVVSYMIRRREDAGLIDPHSV